MDTLQYDILDLWAENITWAEFVAKYHKEYVAWNNRRLLTNCTHHTGYQNYGGRGITMQKDWLPAGHTHADSRKAFITFLQDVGPAPLKNATIDRIDNNGNYEKENVRWVSMQENSLNRRNTIKVNGKPLIVICEDEGLSYSRVRYYRSKGMTIEDALNFVRETSTK